MSLPLTTNSNRIKPGMCPHGMPAGSCPICSGMSGGIATNKRLDVRKAGEMSWSECFAMGLRLKADKIRKQQAIQAHREAQISQLQLQTKLSNLATKLQMLANTTQKTFPKPINKIIPTIIKTIALPTIKFAQTFVNFIQNIAQKAANFFVSVKEHLQGVQEKLAAIFGELFNAKEKSFAEHIKSARKKFFSLLFKTEEEEIEIKAIEQSEQEMELKKVKDSMLNIKHYEKEIDEAENDNSSAI